MEISWDIEAQGEMIGADCTETVKTQRIYDLFKDVEAMKNLLMQKFPGLSETGGVVGEEYDRRFIESSCKRKEKEEGKWRELKLSALIRSR